MTESESSEFPAERAGHGAGAALADDSDAVLFPWPPAPDDSVLDAWGRTWHDASLSPREFFAAMPRRRSPGAAMLYYLSIGIPVAGAQLFWTMVVRGGQDTAGALIAADAPWSPLVEFLMSPLTLLLSLFLAAGVTHLLLRLFGATAEGSDYMTTTRVFAYAYSPRLLGVIPVLGTITGFVWMVVIAIMGLREAHRTSTARAAAAVLIPLFVGLLFAAVAALITRAGTLLNVPV